MYTDDDVQDAVQAVYEATDAGQIASKQDAREFVDGYLLHARQRAQAEAEAATSEWDDRDVYRTLAVIAGIAILAGPRRTRPLSGFLYGVFLMRAASAHVRFAMRAMRGTVERLFDEKQSAQRRIDVIAARLDAAERHTARRAIRAPGTLDEILAYIDRLGLRPCSYLIEPAEGGLYQVYSLPAP